MNNIQIKAGTTDVSVVIRIIDSADGTPETGVVFNTSGIDMWYRRELAASVDITEATLAALTTAHADGGFLHINDGYYRLDLPDAAVAAGATGVLVAGTVTGMVVIGCYIQLVAYDPFDTVRLGLTAMPNVASGSAGAIVTAGTGTAQISVTSGRANADVTHIATAAVNTASAQIGTNVVSTATGAITATSIAADAIGASELAADAVTEIRSLVSGTSDSGTTTTMVDAARTEGDTDYWKGQIIVFTSGTISGQARLITGFTPGTDTITFTPATTQTVGTQTYEIWPNSYMTVNDIVANAITAASIAADAITDAKVASDVTIASVTGAVGSVTGAVGSVTGAVGSVTGNVGGNVTGSVGSVATGGITAASIAADAIGASELAADAVTEIAAAISIPSAATIADAVWDEDATAHQTQGTFGQAIGDPAADTDTIWALVNTNLNATVSSRASQTSVDDIPTNAELATALDPLPTAAENADAVWDEDATGHQTTGTFGQAIGDPVADTNTIYKAVVTDAAGANVAIDVVAVKAETASIQADTNDIQTRLPAALVSGRIDSSVGAMATDVVTAAAIAADAIGSSELAAGAVTEIQSGLATSAALSAVDGKIDTIDTVVDAILVDTGTTLDAAIAVIDGNVDSILVDTGTSGVIVVTNNDKTGYRLSATGVDDILDEAIPEPTGPFTWPGTLRTITGWKGILARNKRTQSATEQVVRDDADTTDVATSAVDVTAGVVTRDEWV